MNRQPGPNGQARGRGGRNARPPRRNANAPAIIGNVPAIPKVLPLNRFEDMCRKYCVPVARQKKLLHKQLEECGVPYMCFDNPDTNTHSFSAAVRQYLTVQALQELALSGCTRVLAFHGSPRDVKTVAFLNKGTFFNKMTIVPYTVPVVAKDVDRSRGNFMPAINGYFDGILFVDVYQQQFGDFDAAWLRDLMNLVRRPGSPMVYAAWVGHYFNGPFGVVYHEGTWKRTTENGQDFITMYVDDQPHNYAHHPPCDWIWKTSEYRDLVWTYKRTVGDRNFEHPSSMCLVNFYCGQGVQYPTTILEPPSLYVELSVPVVLLEPPKTWSSWLMSKLPQTVRDYIGYDMTTVSIPLSLWQDIDRWLALKTRTNLTLFQLRDKVSLSVQSNPDLRLLMRRFPVEFNAYFDKVCIAGFYKDITFKAQSMQALRTSFGSVLSVFNDSLNNLNEPGAPSFLPRLLVMFGGLYAAYKTLKMLQTRYGIKMVNLFLKLFKLKVVPGLAADSLYWIYEKLAATPLPPGFTWWQLFHIVFVAPVYEELAKKFIPYMKHIIPVIEAAKHWQQGGLPYYLPTAVMHYTASACKSLFGSILIHSSWNFFAMVSFVYFYKLGLEFEAKSAQTPRLTAGTSGWEWLVLVGFFFLIWRARPAPTRKTTQAEKFIAENYNREQIPDVIWDDQSQYVSEYAQHLGIVSTDPLPRVDKLKAIDPLLINVVYDRPFREEDRLSLNIPSAPPKTRVYHYLMHNVPIRVPARTDENLWAVLRHRVLVPAPMFPLEQKAAWKEVKHMLNPVDELMDWHVLLPSWLAHFDEPKKKKRYQDALKQYRMYGEDFWQSQMTAVKIFVKTDEALIKEGLKPRAIANVNPAIQLKVGPYVWEATQRLKQQWNVEEPLRWQAYGWTIYLSYAGAATDLMLSRWYVFAAEIKVKTVHILMSGDDLLLVVWNDLSEMHVVEGDASMFDQSQGEGPLDHEFISQRILGVPPNITDIQKRVTKLPYCANSKEGDGRIMISRKFRTMRDTGGANTSFGNSVNIGHATVFAMQWWPNLAKGYNNLGFDMKIKYHRTIQDATFLKGMWYPLRQDASFEYFWGPLPSRILKMGKSITDPRTLYKTKDYKYACEVFASDLAHSYAFFIKIPILQLFQRFRRHAQRRDLLEFYKVAADRSIKPAVSDAVYGQIARRYRVSVEMIRDFERSYPNELFRLHAHPLYAALALVDYN